MNKQIFYKIFRFYLFIGLMTHFVKKGVVAFA